MSATTRSPGRPPALALGAFLVAFASGAGCDGVTREEARPSLQEEASGPAIRPGHEPDALLVRFRETSGTGFSRQGWEIEILQMGSEVRIRGSVRSGDLTVPIYRPMAGPEFAEFWAWMSFLPLDGHQVRIDETAAEAEWKKTLEVDVVLGPENRWLSKNTWTYPLVVGDPVSALEVRLHHLALDIAEDEAARVGREAAGLPTGPLAGEDGLLGAFDALEDGPGSAADTGTPPLE